MKDMYSFHESQEDFDNYYSKVKEAYKKIFERLGLVAKVTEASGGSFSKKISYEFMVLTDAGEDDILYCDSCDYCVNVEVVEDISEGSKCKRCDTEGLKKARASEVGNVFDLGQKYGKDFELGFIGRDGIKQYPIMGCYGIGISRIMGVVVEKLNDNRGIIWPESVAPFKIYLISIGRDEEAKELYKELSGRGFDVLYDDRDKSAGEKFADCDLLGIPFRVVTSQKLEENKFEIKKRDEEGVSVVSRTELFSLISE